VGMEHRKPVALSRRASIGVEDLGTRYMTTPTSRVQTTSFCSTVREGRRGCWLGTQTSESAG
jgi:hypothetical protein